MERIRLRRLGGGCALLLAAGLGYALWVRLTGLALPCPFRAVTGLLCPGCGVDLNQGSCTCKKEVDPRLAVLARLLEKDANQ